MLAGGGPWLRPFAHRGLHDARAPENGMSAFAAAIAGGYGIECDIQPSRDRVPMVFHDPVLRRMTGRPGRLCDHDARALTAMALAGSGDGIPTLAQLLALVAGRVPLLIELKDQSGDLSPGHDALAGEVLAVLAGYAGPVALMSFNPALVGAAHRLRPDLPVGLVSCGFALRDWPRIRAARRAHLRRLADFDAVGAGFVSHDRTDLANPAVQALKARGVPIACWTIRSPAEAVAAHAAGADILTFEGYRP